MYPQSPTVDAWRKVAADNARSSGAEVPYWYDGTQAALVRLRDELPTIAAAVLWFQNRYAVDNAPQFPEAIVTAARGFLEKNPAPAGYASAYALDSYGLGDMAADFAGAAVDQAAEWTADGVTSAKTLLGIAPTLPEDPKPMRGFGLVIVAGVALGGLAWYAFGRKGVA